MKSGRFSRWPLLLGVALIAGCTSRVPLTEKHALAPRPPALQEGGQSWGDTLGYSGRLVWHVAKSQTLAVVRRPLYSAGKLIRLGKEQVLEWGGRTRLTFWDFPRLHLHPVPPVGEGAFFDAEAFEHELDGITETVRGHATLGFCAEGDAFFRRLTEDIQGAKTSVWAQIYIFDNDDVAVALADVLRAKSHEADVRVSFDGLGSLMAAGTPARTRPKAIEGPADMESYLSDGSKVRVRSLPNIWFVGDHTKLFLIDGEKAWLGGMNLGREYRYEWHDLMVSLRGPLLATLRREFERAWQSGDPAGEFSFLLGGEGSGEMVGGAVSPAGGGAEVRLLLTRPGTTQIYDAQMAAIRRARHRIWLENPYLASDAVIYELCAARRRGVDVRVILPDLCNHRLMQASNRLAVNTLRNHGVRVFAYPGMTHVKALLCDGWACFGTANFDKLSFQLNYELSLATSDASTVGELDRALFVPDFKAAREITEHLSSLPGDRLLELIADEL